MRSAGRLSRDDFEALAITRGEQVYRSWTGPVYGLDASWTGPRAAGDAEVENGVLRLVGLGHGDPAAGPLVEVAVTTGDPVILAQRLDRTSRPRVVGVRPVRPEPGVGGAVQATVPVDGEPVPALRRPTGVGWAAAATLPGGLGLAVSARQVDQDDVRIVRVELEPYLVGRRAELWRGYQAGGQL